MFNLLKPKQKPPEKPKTLGQLGEEFAQRFYKDASYEIVGKNVYNKKGLRRGEIDFIAQNKDRIIFVEVKTRSSLAGNKFGTAEESVNFYKQIKLLKAVKHYLNKNPKAQSLVPQVDVCIVEYNEFDNSFECAKILTNAVEDISYG